MLQLFYAVFVNIFFSPRTNQTFFITLKTLIPGTYYGLMDNQLVKDGYFYKSYVLLLFNVDIIMR